MTLLQRYITPLADGTAITTGNSGSASVTANGGSTITWQSGFVVYAGVTSQSCLNRFNFNASNNNVQLTTRWRTPATANRPTAGNPQTLFAFRHTANGRALDVRAITNVGLASYDSANTITNVLAASLLADSTEYVIQVTVVGGSTTAGALSVAVYAVGGAQIGSTGTVTNGNYTVNAISVLEVGGTNPAFNFAFRYLQMNDGAGTYISDYVANVPLDTPAVSVTAFSNPTSVGGSNGSITVSWPPVTGATGYKGCVLAGSVTSGFTEDVDVTSPYTFAGLTAGAKTVAVKAKA